MLFCSRVESRSRLALETISMVIPALVGLAILTILVLPRVRPGRLAQGSEQWRAAPVASREMQIVASVLAVAAVVAAGQWLTQRSFDGGSASLAMVVTLLAWIPLIWQTRQ